MQCDIHLRIQNLGICLLVIVVISTQLRRDGESRRYRQSKLWMACHLRQIRTLTPKQIFHRLVSISLPSAKKINILSGMCRLLC